MRRVFYAPEWPHSPATLDAAAAAGASEIIQGDGGFVVIEEPQDTVDGRLAALADQRNAAAQMTTWRGYAVPCNTDAGTNVNGAILAAQMGGPTSRAWKVAPGESVTLQTADLVDLGLTMAAHIQACFDHEAMLAAKIVTAPDIETRVAIDITVGWPG